MASETKTHTYKHPTLGSLTGLLKTPSIIQYRSIPFATIPGRFRQAVQLNDLGSNRDFTDYGTACPQTLYPSDGTGGSGPPLPNQTPIKLDEFSCLNLTITAPVGALPEGGNIGIGEGTQQKLVPVMVYIHGGAFLQGYGHVSASHGTFISMS